METSKVYILTDEQGRILRCEGGYTMSNINGERWVFIDEGNGDRFNLCQSHYFDSLYDEDGVCRYAYENGVVRQRTKAEMDADRPVVSAPTMSDKERIAELEAALELLLSGVTE